MDSARNIGYSPGAKTEGCLLLRGTPWGTKNARLHSQLRHHRTSAISRRARFLFSQHFHRESYTLGAHPLPGVPSVPPHSAILVIQSCSHWTCLGCCAGDSNWGLPESLPKGRAKTLLWGAHLPRGNAEFKPICFELACTFSILSPSLPQTADTQALGPGKRLLAASTVRSF